MANLYERIISIHNDPDEGEEEISIHAFAGAIDEYRRGELTVAEVASICDLDQSDRTEMNALKDLLAGAQDQLEFLRVMKNWLYIAETLGPDHPMAAKFHSKAQFQARLSRIAKRA